MELKWAEENLQTIRTLMERSAVYRRALAPVMIFLGMVGVTGAVIGWRQHLDTPAEFVVCWYGVAAVALVGASLLIRRQALSDHEPFWSPPTRRVAQALLPPLLAGFAAGVIVIWANHLPADADRWPLGQLSAAQQTHLLPLIWGILYGCALFSAGFFMPRGMKLFGFILIMLSLLALMPGPSPTGTAAMPVGHALMGLIFGVSHLAYGAYLYLSEKGKNAA